MANSVEVERWFKRTKPPAQALRRVRDFAALVRYSEPGVNLRLMRGGRLRGRYPHLEGAVVNARARRRA